MSRGASLPSHSHRINVYDTKQSQRRARFPFWRTRQGGFAKKYVVGAIPRRNLSQIIVVNRPPRREGEEGTQKCLPPDGISGEQRTQLSDYMTTELQWFFSSFTGRSEGGGDDIFLVEYVERWAGSHSRSSWRRVNFSSGEL